MAVSIHIRKALSGFILQVDMESTDKRIGILGASGCGKSMTLKAIAGIVTPDEGRIEIDGRVLFDSREGINIPTEKRKVGYLFQNYALFPNMTVKENIMAGMGKQSKQKKQSKTEYMLGKFALQDLGERYPSQLSGGQQQRVALARMLASEPKVILLDEPFSALDSYLKEKLQHEMMEIFEEYEGAAMMVSHNRDEIYRFATTVMAMAEGKQLRVAPTRQLFLNPQYMEVAKLTGCNNIAPLIKKGDKEIEVPDWGICLKTLETVPDQVKYIGFRSHDIRVGVEGRDNTFLMELSQKEETPFEYKYYISPMGRRSNERIWWKQSKGLEEHNGGEEFPCLVEFLPHKILLLE